MEQRATRFEQMQPFKPFCRTLRHSFLSSNLCNAGVRIWPVASFSAMQRHVRSWGQTGSAGRTSEMTQMTRIGPQSKGIFGLHSALAEFCCPIKSRRHRRSTSRNRRLTPPCCETTARVQCRGHNRIAPDWQRTHVRRRRVGIGLALGNLCFIRLLAI